MKLGYARVSSKGQSLEIQIDELNKAGVERIYSEKVSGTKLDGRDEMAALLITLRPGDEVYVTRMDRMARSVPDTLRIVREIDAAGATLHVLQQPIETKTPAGRMFMVMLAAFAEFETELRRQRQLEGIAKAQEANRYNKGGRPRGPSYDRAVIWHMFERQGMKPSKIAKELGATEWTVRRALKEHSIKLAKDQESIPGGQVVLEVDGAGH
jgi:DNA invertase Pin-like site-specific DNA recombinase